MIPQQTVDIVTQGEASRLNMQRWDIPRKIKYNITHKFSYDFLLKYGYSRFLNNPEFIPGEWQAECTPDEVGELFLTIYRNVYPEEFIKLYAEFKKFFEENPKEGWVPKELYQKYLKA